MAGEGSEARGRVVIPITDAPSRPEESNAEEAIEQKEVPQVSQDRMRDLGIILAEDGETVTSPAHIYYVRGGGQREQIVPKKIVWKVKGQERTPWLEYKSVEDGKEVAGWTLPVHSRFFTADARAEDPYLLRPNLPKSRFERRNEQTEE